MLGATTLPLSLLLHNSWKLLGLFPLSILSLAYLGPPSLSVTHHYLPFANLPVCVYGRKWLPSSSPVAACIDCYKMGILQLMWTGEEVGSYSALTWKGDRILNDLIYFLANCLAKRKTKLSFVGRIDPQDQWRRRAQLLVRDIHHKLLCGCQLDPAAGPLPQPLLRLSWMDACTLTVSIVPNTARTLPYMHSSNNKEFLQHNQHHTL
jgi:hypothetical protein